MKRNGNDRISDEENEGEDKMPNKPTPTCGDSAQTLREWKPVTFEYSEGGVSVRVPNVYTWVCPRVQGDNSDRRPRVQEGSNSCPSGVVDLKTPSYSVKLRQPLAKPTPIILTTQSYACALDHRHLLNSIA